MGCGAPRVFSPACTPPPTGGRKINTKFTKSGPVISPTAVKELLSAQSKGNQPGTLCCLALGIPLLLESPGQNRPDSVSD